MDKVSCLIEIPEIMSVALEVMAGRWSVGIERVHLLEDAGYDYQQVQDCVNDLYELMEKYEHKIR